MPEFPAFARMTAGMTRWARLLQQARPSIENTVENVLIAVTSERCAYGKPRPESDVDLMGCIQNWLMKRSKASAGRLVFLLN